MASAKPKPLEQYKAIQKDIAAGKVAPLYLISGTEKYLTDQLVDSLTENVLDAESREYSLFTYYGKDTTAPDLISACHQSSFFSPQIMVVLKEAQDLKQFDKLSAYFENPNPNCTLVIAFKNKKIDSRTKVYKTAQKNGVVFTSRDLYDNEVRSWLQNFIQEKGLKINPPELELLIAYIGNDLYKLSNEVEKILINLKPGDTISAEDIEKYSGISKDYNAFAISKTIVSHNSQELYRMLRHFTANPKSTSLMQILSILTNFYVQLLQYHRHKQSTDREIAAALKVNPFFVKDFHQAGRVIDTQKANLSLALLYDYNKKAVGIDSASSYADLLTELLIRLFHA